MPPLVMAPPQANVALTAAQITALLGVIYGTSDPNLIHAAGKANGDVVSLSVVIQPAGNGRASTTYKSS